MLTLPSGPYRRERIFYGWIVVVVSTLSLLISNGLAIGGLPVFYKPIQEDLLLIGSVAVQTKDAVTGLGAGLTFLLAGLSSFLIGLVMHRTRPRVLMILGTVVLGLGLFSYTLAEQPAHVYFSHSLLGISLGLVGVMIQTVLISTWFRRKRGTAMGIILTGTSFGGVLIPMIATPFISTYGWRTALLLLSLGVWLILLPAMVFLVRDHPRDVGQNIDGDHDPSAELVSFELAEGASFAEALKTPLFWIIAFCALLIFYPIFTISQQFNLYLQNNVGVSKELASTAQSVLFVTSVGGKFLFGWLCDRFPTRIVITTCCTIMFLSTILLLGFLTPSTVFVFLIPFGLGYGGTFVLIQLLTVESFGTKDIGRILGAITLIETLGGFLGSVVTGQLASLNNGDYTVAFYGVTVTAGLALMCTWGINALSRRAPA